MPKQKPYLKKISNKILKQRRNAPRNETGPVINNWPISVSKSVIYSPIANGKDIKYDSSSIKECMNYEKRLKSNCQNVAKSLYHHSNNNRVRAQTGHNSRIRANLSRSVQKISHLLVQTPSAVKLGKRITNL